ncbi:hypothetical protein EON66_00785 [archaeon]|nr:MAG: hypothetical protein EON66_00785 [archaeon]
MCARCVRGVRTLHCAAGGHAHNFARRNLPLCRRGQYYLDKTVVHPLARWGSFVGLLLIYALRVYLKDGWFIVTYGLGIYLLNLFIGFLTPAVRCPSARRQRWHSSLPSTLHLFTSSPPHLHSSTSGLLFVRVRVGAD